MKTTKLFLFSLVLLMLSQIITTAQTVDQKITDNYLNQIEQFLHSKQLADYLPQSATKTRTSIINIEHFALGGGIVQTLIEEWENNQWVNETRITYSFDYDNRLVGYLMENWKNDKWVNFLKETSTFNDDAYPDIILTQYWNDNDSIWVNSHLDSLMYDSNYNVIKTVGKMWADTGWINQTKNLMAYDDHNNVTESIMQMWQENEWIYINRQVTTYNEKYLKTEWLSQIMMDTEWVDQMKTTYSYNTDDLLIDELSEINMFIEWKTSQIKKYEYNSNKQEIVRYIKEIDPMSGDTTKNSKVSSSYSGDLLTEELTQDWQSTEWVNTTLETYTYEDDQITVVLLQEWKNNAWENKERWTNTYGTVDVEDNRTVVSSFSLEQNYPNPFNPSTTISFAIDKRGHVKLDVYNSLGQLVTKLVDEEKPAGNYQIMFNAVNLPSGVYYYRLSAGNKVMTKKCILLK